MSVSNVALSVMSVPKVSWQQLSTSIGFAEGQEAPGASRTQVWFAVVMKLYGRAEKPA